MQKSALVTGASSGIGEAIVKNLIRDGYTVYAAARRLDRMHGLEEAGAEILYLDLVDPLSIQGVVSKIAENDGRLDVLINNAGYGSYGALEDVPIEEGRRQFEVNLFALAHLTQLVIPIMRAQGSGKIVNITSVGGKAHEPFGAWYHATKFAVEGMSDCLRMELEPFGIDVIVIEPGAIQTEWSDIAQQSLIDTSGDTVYGARARSHAAMLKRTDMSLVASPPSVVADTISKAIAAKRPKTRYPTGGGAKAFLLMRHAMSDRQFDKFMAKMSAGKQS